jgi:hypothetical protein
MSIFGKIIKKYGLKDEFVVETRKVEKMTMKGNHNEFKDRLLTPKNTSGALTFKTLIHMGSYGHLPLFHEEWIKEAINSKEKKTKFMSYKDAKFKVKTNLEKLEAHRNIERKKTALFQMPNEERNELINAFLKVVEFEVLDNFRELH